MKPPPESLADVEGFNHGVKCYVAKVALSLRELLARKKEWGIGEARERLGLSMPAELVGISDCEGVIGWEDHYARKANESHSKPI